MIRTAHELAIVTRRAAIWSRKLRTSRQPLSDADRSEIAAMLDELREVATIAQPRSAA